MCVSRGAGIGGARVVKGERRRPILASMLFAGCVAVSVLSGAVLAQGPLPAADPTPPLTPQEARARTLSVFEHHCAQCHDSSRSGSDGTGAKFGNILDLDDLATDPALLTPGVPDASPVYHVLLDGHQATEGVGTTAEPGGPSAADVEAVRDWIESLPPVGENCATGPLQSEEETARLMQLWRRQFPAQAADTRFVSLAHLANVCLSARQLQRYRADTAAALARLAGRPQPPDLETVGDLSVLLAFRLGDAGLSVEDWDRVAARSPRTTAGALPADWLAHDVEPTGRSSLARRYRDDVNLRRAAAEAGLSESALWEKLATIEGAEARLARLLRQWQIPRGDWEELYQAIGSTPGPKPVIEGSVRLRLGLWSDKPVYAVGELVTFSAMSNRDCHLTVVGVDRDGYATVLFPNDFQPDNKLRAGSPLSLPLRSETFQLRASQTGREMAVGFCTLRDRRPEGIYHDFEGQRFTILGSWRAFLRQRAEREAEIARLGPPRTRRRSRRDTPQPDVNGADAIARAAIVFRTE